MPRRAARTFMAPAQNEEPEAVTQYAHAHHETRFGELFFQPGPIFHLHTSLRSPNDSQSLFAPKVDAQAQGPPQHPTPQSILRALSTRRLWQSCAHIGYGAIRKLRMEGREGGRKEGQQEERKNWGARFRNL